MGPQAHGSSLVRRTDARGTTTVLDRLLSGHIDRLQHSLGRATERHSLLSNNLANVNTPGYKRRDISFNVLLEGTIEQMESRERYLDRQAQLASNRSSLRQDGNNVDLEREVVAISETQLRYEALAELTAQYFSGLKSVIREGR
jgi:flagellar basal-body rod protein FlgB